MPVIDGRQQAETLEGIRDDHVARYRFAADLLPGKVVIDAAAGVGYGSAILAERAARVEGFEKDPKAVWYYRTHYRRPNVDLHVGDVEKITFPPADAAVSFETLEHLRHPEKMLRSLAQSVPLLIGSVPNEDVLSFDPKRHKYHQRHYSVSQLRQLLAENFWVLKEISHQAGKSGLDAEVQTFRPGMTLVFSATSIRGLGG